MGSWQSALRRMLTRLHDLTGARIFVAGRAKKGRQAAIRAGPAAPCPGSSVALVEFAIGP